MSTNALSNIPRNALVRFIALLDDDTEEEETTTTTTTNNNDDDNQEEQEQGVTMNCAQAASLSKLVADQAAATEWEEEEQEGDDKNENEDDKNTKQQPAPEVLIPVPVGTTENLKAIVRYLTSRLASPQREIPAPLVGPLEDAVDDCDRAFLNSLATPRKDVIPLASIAHYLNIPTLRDLMCALLANQLSTMNVEQMRTVLGVSNDFSNQEINVLKKEFGLIDEAQWGTSSSVEAK